MKRRKTQLKNTNVMVVTLKHKKMVKRACRPRSKLPTT
jgi:hypothetical protein